jgi:hypothetical protein
LNVAKKKPSSDPLSFDFGYNKAPRRKPRFKPTAAQRAAFALYHGKGGKKK